MIKKIGLAIVIAAMLWGVSSYIIPTLFIKAKLLNKIENKENLTIIPEGKFQDVKIDHSYIQSLRDYSLGHLSFSIPQEYELYSSKDDAMVFKIDAKKCHNDNEV